MVAWVVIFNFDPRRAAPCRHVTKIPSPQLLSLPHLQNRDARNPFRFRSYANTGVSPAFSLLLSAAQLFRCSRHSLLPYIVTSLPPYFLFSKSFRRNTYASPADVANKRLTRTINPLDATLIKNRGWGPTPSQFGTCSLRCTSLFPLCETRRQPHKGLRREPSP